MTPHPVFRVFRWLRACRPAEIAALPAQD